MVFQYFVLLCSSLLGQFGNAIDAGFANSLGYGVICIFAIIGSLKLFLATFLDYGAYYFRLTGKRERAGIYLNLIFAFLASFFFLAFPKTLYLVFSLEEQYRPLFEQCLRVVFLFLPFEAASSYLSNYMVYANKEKMCMLANAAYYACLILLDAVAVICFQSAQLVLAGTGICCVAHAAVIYLICGIRYSEYKMGDLKIVLKDGFPIFFNRAVSRICVILINSAASRLGTEQYALLSVTRKSLETAQTVVHTMMPVMTVRLRGMGKKAAEIFRETKPLMPAVCFMFLLTGSVSLAIVKGEFTWTRVILPALVVNLTSLPTYYLYEIAEIKANADGNGKLLAHMAEFRLAMTALICLASLYGGLPWLMLYSTISDLAVGLAGHAECARKQEKLC